ncbi:MAG: adenylate kinase [Saprospiraceae bacterium]|nr:adenylate kinase [Saprospiraceae bacterium]
MLNLILFGPPGSGKGTQAESLIKKYNLFHISTGDMFRFELSNNTELGELARSYMDKGQLVPDSVTISMLQKRVEDNPHVKGFIFDGFPRTITQAEALDAFLAGRGEFISGLVELVVDEDEVTKRLLLRGESSGRADDKDEEIIRRRFQVYRAETSPVAQHYKKKKRAHKVKGVGTIDDIFKQLCAKIDKL